jgi:hypothetical protein
MLPRRTRTRLARTRVTRATVALGGPRLATCESNSGSRPTVGRRLDHVICLTGLGAVPGRGRRTAVAE